MADQASITIKPGSLQNALDAYSQATGTKMVYLNELIEGKNSPGAQHASPGDALEQILQGTGLTFQMADNNTAVLKEKKPTAEQPVAAQQENKAVLPAWAEEEQAALANTQIASSGDSIHIKN